MPYLFAAAPEAFDYGPAKLQREGCLWGIRAGDRVAGTCGANHCALKRMYESEEMQLSDCKGVVSLAIAWIACLSRDAALISFWHFLSHIIAGLVGQIGP